MTQNQNPVLKQGSLHYTPEHCLVNFVNCGFPLFWWNKNLFSNWQHVSFKEPWKVVDPAPCFKNSEARYPQLLWLGLSLTFIYPGFDCGSSGPES